MCEDTFKPVPSIRGTKVLEKGTSDGLPCRYGNGANGVARALMGPSVEEDLGGNHG